MADALKDETDQTLTIGEYIEELEAEELEADLVLGGDEGKECTYPSGYMKRQAIFSCLTCVPSGNAGVCTACSLSCHDGHEVVELWTKRKFCCDCGNSKFGEFSCKLHPDKEPENSENSYNHNFRGSYCTCGRPYPDPDAKEQIEMIQCCICEDWFHDNHLGLNSPDEIPRDEDGEPVYDDFICEKCATTFSFLKFYAASIWALPKQKNAPAVQSSTENVMENGCLTALSAKAIDSHISQSEIQANCSSSSTKKDSTCENSTEVNASSEDNKAWSEDRDSTATCPIGVVIISESTLPSEKAGPMFLLKKWRELLCKCRSCSEFYTRKGVDFLTDKEDTIEEYEKMGKSKREEKLKQQEGAELNFLNTLDHVQKIEIFSGIADMKNELHSFLESFDSSKPVTSEDIKGVFENLAKKKKQRLASELLLSSLSSRFPPRNPPPVLTHRRAKQEAVSFAVASSLPLGVADLARDKVLVAAAIAGTIGKLSKPLTSAISGKGIDLRMAVQSGGMPSAHSAAVTAAATLLGLERGFSASVFGMSVVFAALFMYDAQGARREVGIHAKILNKIQNSHAEPTAQNSEEDHYQSKRLRSSSMNCEENSPLVSISDKEDSYLIQRPAIASTEVKISDCTKVDNTEEPIHMEQYRHSELNESVGHTEIQVIVGALLGLVVGLATELTL